MYLLDSNIIKDNILLLNITKDMGEHQDISRALVELMDYVIKPGSITQRGPNTWMNSDTATAPYNSPEGQWGRTWKRRTLHHGKICKLLVDWTRERALAIPIPSQMGWVQQPHLGRLWHTEQGRSKDRSTVPLTWRQWLWHGSRFLWETPWSTTSWWSSRRVTKCATQMTNCS